MTWPEVDSLAEITAPWTVVYCKPRQEKALAWDLHRKGISYFLPMVLRETSSGGRRRRNLYPLFPSYIFFAGTKDDRLEVLKTERTVHLIDVDEPERPIFQREIASLEKTLRHCPESLELHPRLIPGAHVSIGSGPLKGVEGIIVDARNKRRLWLGVSVLGVGAIVELPADLVTAP